MTYFSAPPERQKAVVHDISEGTICWCGHPNGAAPMVAGILREAMDAVIDADDLGVSGLSVAEAVTEEYNRLAYEGIDNG